MQKIVQKVDFPLLGKVIVAFMAVVQVIIYSYLLAAHNSSRATVLSCLLLITAVLTLLQAGCSMPPNFYFRLPLVYCALVVLVICLRIASMVLLVKFNDSPSQEFYLTEDGFHNLQLITVMMIAVAVVLLYEKAHFHLTRNQLKERLAERITRL